MYCTRMRSGNTTTRCVYRYNCYIESSYSIRPLSKEGYTLNSGTHIKSEGPLKGHYAKAYKLKNPLPMSGRKRIGNIEVTITLSGDLAPR